MLFVLFSKVKFSLSQSWALLGCRYSKCYNNLALTVSLYYTSQIQFIATLMTGLLDFLPCQVKLEFPDKWGKVHRVTTVSCYSLYSISINWTWACCVSPFAFFESVHSSLKTFPVKDWSVLNFIISKAFFPGLYGFGVLAAATEDPSTKRATPEYRS